MQKENQSQNSDEELLATARKRFDIAVEAESEIRKIALEDMRFSAGEQWPEDVKRQRDADKRPCLTINRLPQFIRQITNDQRQNRPSIKVSPLDNQGDVELAEIFQGMIRHIENSSDADTAYDTAFDRAVRGSFGYFRVVTDYSDPMSFDQDIKIKRIRNQFSVYLDPSYQEPDGSDASWGFVFEDLPKDDYKAQFKESKMSLMDDWSSIGDSKPGWATNETIRVAEYFYKTYRKAMVVLLSNKETIEKDQLPEGELPNGLTVVSERETMIPEIKWCKINAVEVLERTEWPGKWIPIIPVLGDELDIDGRRILESLIRHAKDPQRMYNYWKSSETETIALAPRVPYIGVEGQFEGHEAQWNSANVRNHSYLEYKAKSVGGQLAPPPQRNVYEPPVQAISQASMMAADDLKSTTGIYDAALGNQARETSGIAIQRRNNQSQISNFHFVDNLAKSIRHGGRIIVDLIPHIYDTARAVRILGEDGTEEVVMLNQIFERNGKQVNYQTDLGKYDVSVSSGPSFETKRQEALASMLDLTKSMPQVMQIAGDLLVRNMDWPGAEEIADRLKKTLPPNLADDNKNQQPLPPQVQAQMQQMGQLIQQLTDHLNQKTQLIENKALELESKERIAMAQIQAEIQLTLAKLGSTEALTLLDHQVSQIDTRLERLHESQSIEDEINMAGSDQGALPQMNQQQPTGGQTAPGQPVGAP